MIHLSQLINRYINVYTLVRSNYLNIHICKFGSIPGGGILPYMGHIGMCRCEGYGSQAVYFSIRYINQSVWVYNRLSFFTKLTSWLNILSRLRKSGIASQKYKQMISASLNFHDTASTALIHDYLKTVLDISINLLVVYRESINLIGYITRRLSADSLQL